MLNASNRKLNGEAFGLLEKPERIGLAAMRGSWEWIIYPQGPFLSDKQNTPTYRVLLKALILSWSAVSK